MENHAGAQFNGKVPVLEDLLASRLAGEGFSIISRAVTVNALKSYDTAGIAVSSQSAVNANTGSVATRNLGLTENGQANSEKAAGITANNGSFTNTDALNLARSDSAQIAGTQSRTDTASGHSSANIDLAQSDSAQVAVTGGTTKLDQALNNNTSALRLAQNLGADFILIPSITSYGTKKTTYTGNGIATITTSTPCA